MGVYLFNMKVLRQWLEARAGNDFGRHILPKMVNKSRIFAYTFKGYWRDIGTVESYWQSNMEIIKTAQSFLMDNRWLIHTREHEWPPIKIGDNATVTNSLLSAGCLIDGRVEHSVISPGVCVAEGAFVKDSIIMDRTLIGRGSVIDRAILDKDITMGADSHIGFGDDFRVNRLSADVLNTGLTIVGKRAAIPSKFRIGRNCIVYDSVTGNDLPVSELKSGETVKHKRTVRPKI
jgi:glucose-1-phosphate adenylyltransferase